MGNYRIIIADDDLENIELLKMTLGLDNYEIVVTFDGTTVLNKSLELKPDLILLDNDMPGMNGHEVCSILKKYYPTRYIPVIILSGTRTKVSDKINGLQAGADDYIIKPFEPDELRVRISRSIVRAKEMISINPLTKLPGSTQIEQEIIKRMNSGCKFAVAYIDLDNFKAYNDMYGYKKGDDVIHLLNNVIFEAIARNGGSDDFVGHIGGDDFIMVTSPDKIEVISSYITNVFDAKISRFYADEDIARGGIVTQDRRGNTRFFPVMTISVAISTNEKREISHYGELIAILIEMKRYAKSLDQRMGSIFVKDRRTSRTIPGTAASPGIYNNPPTNS